MRQGYLYPELSPEQSMAPEVVNVASVPQRSPFRYPGGKTWLVPLFRRWTQSLPRKPKYLIEPFAGGGILSLTAVFENLVERVIMVELDEQIAAVWKTIVGGEGEWLANRILHFDLTKENLLAELSTHRRLTKGIAFQTILKNRTYHGGILAEGSGVLKHGENGKGIHSRWYPQTLARRIRCLSLVANRMKFVWGNGLKVLKSHSADRNAIFFIDPPYTAGGKRAGSRLYTHYELDHERLFKMCAKLKGDFLITYDNVEEVRAMARRHGLQVWPVAMKGTHHTKMTELLIGRDLAWIDDSATPANSSHDKVTKIRKNKSVTRSIPPRLQQPRNIHTI